MFVPGSIFAFFAFSAFLSNLGVHAEEAVSEDDSNCLLQPRVRNDPTLAPTQPPPPPGVKVEGQAGNTIGRVVKHVTGDKINNALVEADALLLLKEHKLVERGTAACTSCSSPDASWTCCFQWTLNGMTIFDAARLSNQGADPKITVTLKSEDQMDKGLLQFVNGVPVESASERNQLLGQLRSNNVFTKSQLASLRPDQLAQLSPAVQSSVNQESNAQQINSALTPGAREARLEALKPENFADLAAAKALQGELKKEAKTAADKGINAVEEAADLLTSNIKTSIGTLTTLTGDVSTKTLVEQLNAAVKNTGSASGSKWSIDDLIRRNGLLRGVTLRGQISQTLMKEVVQFTNDFRTRAPDDDVKKRVLTMNPDEQATEVSLQSTDASSLQTSNRVMETFGMSSYKSKSWSFFVGLGSPSNGGIGFSVGGSKSAGGSNNADSQSTEQLSETTKSVSKSNYYFEPRTIIAIESEDLEPTPSFIQALSTRFGSFFADGDSIPNSISSVDAQMTATTVELAAPINLLFDEFGTHVCHRAMLGGWWRITASYQSTKSVRNVDAQRIVSAAIERSRTFSVGAQGSGAGAIGPPAPAMPAAPAPAGEAAAAPAPANSIGGQAGGGSGKAQNYRQGEGLGWRDMQDLVDEDSVMDVKQEWKGGSSGTAAKDWRKSLNESMSSNWQVIDRYGDDCTGIWRWVPNRALRSGICVEWTLQIVAELDPEGVLLGSDKNELIEASCAGEGDLRETLLVLAADKMKQKHEVARRECEDRVGYHYDRTKNICEQNFCKCGNAFITGEQCVIHGSMACPDDMRAQCRELTCPPGYHAHPDKTTDLCQLDTCDAERDRDTCCKDNLLAQSLKIKFRMSNPGTNKLYVQFRTATTVVPIVSGPGEAFDKAIDGNTQWWEYKDDQPGDLGKNSEGEFTANLAVPLQFPAKICVALHRSAGMYGKDMLLHEDLPVTVTNTEAPSADNILGYATGFSKLDAEKGPDFECKWVQPRGR